MASWVGNIGLRPKTKNVLQSFQMLSYCQRDCLCDLFGHLLCCFAMLCLVTLISHEEIWLWIALVGACIDIIKTE